jgi:hypothetical protein
MIDCRSHHQKAAHGATVRSGEAKYLWKSGSFHPENVKKPAKHGSALES